MSANSSENSNELVLDNRKLIVVFLLLIAVCGAFFLIGFMEGKRQGQRARSDQAPNAAVPGASAQDSRIPEAQGPAAAPGGKPIDGASIPRRLDWYKEVSERNQAASRTSPEKASPGAEVRPAPDVAEPAPARPTPPTPSKGESRVPATSAGGVRYSVQVGAFRQSAQAESRAASLKAKGYPSRVVPPAGAGELYIVRVGEYDSRADAVAMQLRLKRDGISSFIKSAK